MTKKEVPTERTEMGSQRARRKPWLLSVLQYRNFSFFERLVGAGLALPLSYVHGVRRGQGKPSPFETHGLRPRQAANSA